MDFSRSFIHLVGFELDMSPQIIYDTLKPFIHNLIDNLRPIVYTTVLFNEDQQIMKSWYNKRKDKTIDGWISAIYVGKKEQIVVAEMNIESKSYYVTLVHNKLNYTLQQLKIMTSRGDFGERIPLDPKLEIKCKAYKKNN